MVFVGHISMDKVSNVNGVREQPGGAALYAAVAARTLFNDVRIISAVGRDFRYFDLLKIFDKIMVKVVDLPSTRFNISYDENWNAYYSDVVIGAGMHIRFDSIPVSWLTSNSIVHLCPMRPSKVERMINRIRYINPRVKISVNTWSGYMRSRENRSILRRIASRVDFFILNESEVKALTMTDSLVHAINVLDCKSLVVTLGELGAIVKFGDEVMMIPALRTIRSNIVDVTGAGDCWCGAFLAAYKLCNDVYRSVIVASIISSIKCSGWGFEKLLNLKFNSLDEVSEYIIKRHDKLIQKSITEYFKGI